MHDSEPFYVNKWLTFSACAALQFTAALPYTFGLFSADFKERFHWSQSELTGFGTAMNFGAFAAILPGYFYSSLSGFRHGPRCGRPTFLSSVKPFVCRADAAQVSSSLLKDTTLTN